jgi:hypothetical protein
MKDMELPRQRHCFPVSETPASTYAVNAQVAHANFHQNPYTRWWSKGAAGDPGGETLAFRRLDQPLFTPGIKAGFKFHADDKFFAIGSCFARGIEYQLRRRRMQVLSAAPEFAVFETINDEVTGLGFTNKYNTFSMLNELQWALDPAAEFPRDSIVEVTPGRWMDPHITPVLPLADWDETWRRRSLIQMVNQRVAQCRVVIITLGLVEVWYDTATETFINSTPPMEIIRRSPDRYQFHVTDFAQNLANVEGIQALLARFGHPDVQIIVTVSPVPLMATFSGQDVVLANTYSKSLLRAVAQQWANGHPNVHYFPSYEIVLNSNRAETWKPDRRHVSGKVSRHIMSVFLNTYGG